MKSAMIAVLLVLGVAAAQAQMPQGAWPQRVSGCLTPDLHHRGCLGRRLFIAALHPACRRRRRQCAGCLSCCRHAAAAPQEPWGEFTRPQLIGHRGGACDKVPEHSLASYKAGFEVGK